MKVFDARKVAKNVRVLKNLSGETVMTNFRGKFIKIPPKHSITFNDSEAHDVADYLLKIYSFLKDITDRVLKKSIALTPEEAKKAIKIQEAEGVRVKK